MTRTRTRDDLAELRARLEGGIGPAARDARLGNWPDNDARALAGWDPGADFAILGSLRGNPWKESAQVPAVVKELAKRLRGDRRLLLCVLFSPARAFDRVAETAPGGPAGVWIGLCWTAEAAWHVMQDALPEPDYATGDDELLRPLAARLRFLTLSEPMRWRTEPSRAWWYAEEYQNFDGTDLVRRVNGEREWHVLVGQCREARRAWLDYLGRYQSHSYLVQATPAGFETELAAVMFRHGKGGAPLGLPGENLLDEASLTAGDAAVVDDLMSRHLLPRFDLLRVLSIAACGNGGRVDRLRGAFGGIVVACAVTAVTYATLLHAQRAAGLSALCYLFIGTGIVWFGPEWAAPWLLRLPAAAAVGVIALLSVVAGGWTGTPHVGLAGAIVLIAAACGYLIVQLRNHGVAGWSLTRALGVGLIGAVHALMVSLLGLVYVAPAFVPAQDRTHLAGLWSSPRYESTGLVLLLAAAWCFAVGVFSQILWDDRPITAPLAHMSWRK